MNADTAAVENLAYISRREEKMIPADLLVRLQEADPALWRRYDDTDLSSDEMACYACTFVDELKEAWLQHCLQESIRARGWFLFLSTHDYGERVFVNAEIRNRDYMHIGRCTKLEIPEAEALCLAYLAAIEAVQ